MQHELKKEIDAIKLKIEDLDRWLIHNWNHPDRSKIFSDRNHWYVKLDTAKRKLQNVHNGIPLLGYSGGMPDTNLNIDQRRRTHN